MTPECNYVAFEDHIIVRPVDPPKGKIALPDHAKSRQALVEVLSIGEGHWLDSAERASIALGVGMHIIVYAGREYQQIAPGILAVDRDHVIAVMRYPDHWAGHDVCCPRCQGVAEYERLQAQDVPEWLTCSRCRRAIDPESARMVP